MNTRSRSTRCLPAVLLAAPILLGSLACGSKDDGATVRNLGTSGGSGTASGTGSGTASGTSSGTASGTSSGTASGSGTASDCTPVDPGTTVAGTTVRLELGDFVVVAEPKSVPAGTVTLVATNVGKERHEVVVVKADDVASLPKDEHGGFDEEAFPADRILGEIEGVASGTTCAQAFDLAPGTYLLLCNITETEPDGTTENHLAEGMVTTFTVT